MIFDSAAPGSWNMAVDEALLHTAAEHAEPCLRFYTWSEPTLSLGYFQAAAERTTHAPSADATLVRRSTGGGAILHHLELTYSITCFAPERSDHSSRKYYLAVHEAAIELLSELGLSTRLATRADTHDGPEPFLCFLRRADGDLLASEHKVLGSAQRRHKGGLLQHGSLLLARSPLAPELPGVESLSRVALDSHVLAERWSQHIARRLDWHLNASALTPAERDLARSIEAAKFRDKGWTHRR